MTCSNAATADLAPIHAVTPCSSIVHCDTPLYIQDTEQDNKYNFSNSTLPVGQHQMRVSRVDNMFQWTVYKYFSGRPDNVEHDSMTHDQHCHQGLVTAGHHPEQSSLLLIYTRTQINEAHYCVSMAEERILTQD